MLRKEVLKGWQGLREKLKTVLLTPQEKEAWKFLENSKVANFFVSAVDLPSSPYYKNLDKLREEVETERVKDIEDFGENELLCDYSLLWTNCCSLILEWINLRTVYDYQKEK